MRSRRSLKLSHTQCCQSCTYCAQAFSKERNCVTQLSCVNPVTNVTNAVQNLPVGARLKTFRQTWLDLGAGPKVV